MAGAAGRKPMKGHTEQRRPLPSRLTSQPRHGSGGYAGALEPVPVSHASAPQR